jgi:diguanylate cyclase (GGDEF)-like protein
MAPQTVDPEILDAMILSEIAVKYECYSQAVDILSALNRKHPKYLPAKEALQKIYRDTGKSEQANQLENEMNDIRAQLAADRIQHNGNQTDLHKRQFIAKIDSIVREIYDTRNYQEVLDVSASGLLETIRADRCLIWVPGSSDWQETKYVSSRKGVSPCPWKEIEKLNAILWQLISETQDTISLEKMQTSPIFVSQREILQTCSIYSILACPLIYKSTRAGMIMIHSCREESSWNDEEISVLSTVAGHTAVALQNARHFNEAQNRGLKDQLTGLESPQFFEERLAVEMRNACQQDYPLCLGLLYVNDFQDIIMTQGQASAETVLHKVGFLVKTHVRKGSVVGRTGNEEFGMILPNVPKERAQQIMNNIKQIVENTITTDSGRPVTVGIGVIEATLSPTLWTTQALSEAEDRESPMTSGGSNQDSAAFRGDLSEIELLDVLQILANGRKSGKLVLSAEGHLGIIFFNLGRIVDAVYQGKRAELAFFEILTIKKARFEFQSSPQPFGIQIGYSNTQLILEGLRLLDEANQERQLTASH